MNKMAEQYGKSPWKVHLRTIGCQMNAAKMPNIGFVPNLMLQVVESMISYTPASLIVQRFLSPGSFSQGFSLDIEARDETMRALINTSFERRYMR